jgi:cytochrome c
MKGVITACIGCLIVAMMTSFAFSQDAEKLYAKCKGCHGPDGTKVDAGIPRALKGIPAADLEKAMKGYRDGSYGGAKKNVMTSMVKNLSDEDIKALVKYVAGF